MNDTNRFFFLILSIQSSCTHGHTHMEWIVRKEYIDVCMLHDDNGGSRGANDATMYSW